MVETVELLGVKFKISFIRPIKSLKLIAEAEEKICRKCEYHIIHVPDELLTLEKRKSGIEFRLSLKPDDLIFYTNATEENLDIAIEEFKIVMTEFRNIMYSYMGENPKINNIVVTKGYNATNDEFIEYLESLNFGFNKNGVSSSIKYDRTEDMSLKLRKYFVDEEYTNNYLNKLDEYTDLLI